MRTILNILASSVVIGITFISLQADAQEEPPQTIPVIIVTSPPYHPPGIDPLERPEPPSNGLDDKGQPQRDANCKYYNNAFSLFKCDKVATDAPTTFEQINRPSSYYTTLSLIWSAPILAYAQAMFNNGGVGRAAAERTAYQDSITACGDKGNGICARQVTQFFGITTFDIPDALPYGASQIINNLLAMTPVGGSFGGNTNNAAIGAVYAQFGDALICKTIRSNLDKNAC